MLLSLYLINKSGGLIFQQDISNETPKLSSNDHLRLGSTFHSIHAIAALVSPIQSDGIRSVEAGSFRLQCFQPPTGTKFIVLAAPNTPNLEYFLASVYELYSDYVLKNPFYESEMPIRCRSFNSGLKRLVERFNSEILYG